MKTALRSFVLLALIAWLGGLIFFAFVLAPVAFTVLPATGAGTHGAGLVVGSSLRILHGIGLVSGVVLILLLAAGARTRVYRCTRPVRGAIGLLILMLASTAYSQFSIIPRMDAYRTQAGGNIEQSAPDDPGRLGFNRLHRISEHFEEAVLLLGLGVVVLLARADTGPAPRG